MAQYLLDLVYSLTTCLTCFPSSPNLTINARSFKILSLLGEGGFSYVYLVQDSTGSLHALKKIRCPFGQESLSTAINEAESYSRFAPHPNLISCTDYAVVNARGGGGGGTTVIGRDDEDSGEEKIVYILLPYFRRGNLQDAVNANLVNHSHFPEKHLLRLFRGVCEGVRALHEHTVSGPSSDEEGSSSAGASEPLMRNNNSNSNSNKNNNSNSRLDAKGTPRAYAHRDIKPGNVMIADDGATPVLMDFGSLTASPTPVTNRTQALAVQDHAAETSTMPYRPPELFDVKTGSVVDEKVDIWSLGCTLFCALYGHSPFELATEESGGSLALAICSGVYSFPKPGRLGGRKVGGADVSERVKDIVRMCLKVEPAERPAIGRLIEEVDRVIEELPDDED